jgi:hypothetical protein
MALAESLAAFERALVSSERDGLRRPASAASLTGAARELGATLPPSFAALYAWHDGESTHSALFDDALRPEIESLWSAFSEAPFEIRFMTLDEVKRAGTDQIWMLPDGSAYRGKPDGEGATQVEVFPFVWVQEREDRSDRVPREPGDHDWLLAVDGVHGKVWMFEIAGETLETVEEQAPDLGTWMENLAELVVLARDEEEGDDDEDSPASVVEEAAAPNAPPMLLMRFLLDRNLIELAEGATPAAMAAKLLPLLSIRPPKAAVKAVLETLTDSDLIDEVFADDAILSRIIIEFVD